MDAWPEPRDYRDTYRQVRLQARRGGGLVVFPYRRDPRPLLRHANLRRPRRGARAYGVSTSSPSGPATGPASSSAPASTADPSTERVSTQPPSEDVAWEVEQNAALALKELGPAAGGGNPGADPGGGEPGAGGRGDRPLHRGPAAGTRTGPRITTPRTSPTPSGCLWGDQLVARFGWHWAMATFHDHGDTQAPAVISPDHKLAVYPIHFILGCLQDPSVDVTILLSWNLLDSDADAEAVRDLPPHGYPQPDGDDPPDRPAGLGGAGGPDGFDQSVRRGRAGRCWM